MGGRWVFAVLLVFAIGCSRATQKPCSPEIEIKECPEPPPPPVCPTPEPAPTQIQTLSLQNKYFESLQEREKIIEDLRKQNEDLKQEVSAARIETDDWRNRFYDNR